MSKKFILFSLQSIDIQRLMYLYKNRCLELSLLVGSKGWYPATLINQLK